LPDATAGLAYRGRLAAADARGGTWAPTGDHELPDGLTVRTISLTVDL
jgi:hypothetical protein